MSDTAETKAPTRKTAAKKPVEKDEAKATVTLRVGDTVLYKPIGCRASVTGVDAKGGKLYLDTPVVKWVPASDCSA